MKILSFSEALVESSKYNKKHILLGNGFSISCRPDIFIYGKLLENADFSKLSISSKKAFECLNTQNFEHVIKAMKNTKSLLDAYENVSDELKEMIEKDADGLKELLVQTIAKSHPSRPGDISDNEYENCRIFLGNFDSVYTFNYDLLIYWAYMHEDKTEVISDDGFRKPDYDYESSYVTWESSQSHGQNLWFLHGALHVFDAGTEVRKFTWKNTGIALIDQIRDAINRNYYPIFVAEGTSDEKLERIRHSDYLAKAYRSFQEIQGSLFIYGHSLAPNDEHFLRIIEKGKIKHIFVGLYGNPESKENKKIIKRATLMTANRNGKNVLNCSFFNSETAKVWK